MIKALKMLDFFARSLSATNAHKSIEINSNNFSYNKRVSSSSISGFDSRAASLGDLLICVCVFTTSEKRAKFWRWINKRSRRATCEATTAAAEAKVEVKFCWLEQNLCVCAKVKLIERAALAL